MAFVNESKTREEMMSLALRQLTKRTPITSIGPGSIARSLVEIMVDELSDFYGLLDRNTSNTLLSKANGRALDLIGQMYNVERKTLSTIAAQDQKLGQFYFYLTEPAGQSVTIPAGTKVTTDDSTFVGRNYRFITSGDATIAAGRLRAYVGITPEFRTSNYAIGKGTLTTHDFEPPVGIVVRCTNPKQIDPIQGYESDAAFRARISKSIRANAGGTLQAIRFSGLAAEGVRDIRMRNLPFGLGTVEAVVVPEDVTQADVILARASELMNEVRPAGVRLSLRQPVYISLSANASIKIRNDVQVDRSGTARRAELGMLRYLNSLLPGGTLYYSRLIESVLDASDAIEDVIFTQLRIGTGEILRENYIPKFEEQIIPGQISVTST